MTRGVISAVSAMGMICRLSRSKLTLPPRHASRQKRRPAAFCTCDRWAAHIGPAAAHRYKFLHQIRRGTPCANTIHFS